MPAKKKQNTNLRLFLENFSEDQLSDYFSSKILNQGKEFYEDGHVVDSWYEGGGETLFGNIEDKQEYETSLRIIEDNKIEGKCTCEVHGNCKHMAALMYCGLNEEIPVRKESATVDYKKYFLDFSKHELIDIILKHVDKKFLSDLNKKFKGTSDSENIFKKTQKAIKDLLKNEYQLQDPGSFTTVFSKQFQKIHGLEHHLGKPLEEFFFEVIDKIDEAINDGMLYDHYYDQTFEGPEIFDAVVKNYAISLGFDAKVDFLHDLENKVENCSYNIFSGLMNIHKTVFSTEELKMLKNLLVKESDSLSDIFIENGFYITEHLMSEEEKTIPLSALNIKDEKIILKLAEIYVKLKDQSKAKKILKEWLTKNNYLLTNVYNYYLNLVGVNDPDFENVALDAIQRCCDHQTLITINLLTGKINKNLESIVEKKDKWEFLKYLEESDRIPDAINFASKCKGENDLENLFSFYSRHKKKYPKEAESYFVKFIDYHLISTGDYHYNKIEDAVRQIKNINKDVAKTIIDNICRDYKRRINLTRLLKNI